jgi:hypothetical protein
LEECALPGPITTTDDNEVGHFEVFCEPNVPEIFYAKCGDSHLAVRTAPVCFFGRTALLYGRGRMAAFRWREHAALESHPSVEEHDVRMGHPA